MGIILNAVDISALERPGIPRPVIFCNQSIIHGTKAVSINIEMAKKLAAIRPNRRTLRIGQCFQQVLDTLPNNVVISDFDVMFNPNYAIDVLKIICSAAKSKPFYVIWPGKYENGRLIYAEEGYIDYKTFEISKYDITCVV